MVAPASCLDKCRRPAENPPPGALARTCIDKYILPPRAAAGRGAPGPAPPRRPRPKVPP
ncbi:hypothetical protein ISF6_0520 [Piscinibacter sakaiensis]|uniref:Uncharacterized protein n=1 Tax=Piscinibacter sakaiensis TaxID=1547922 RepID=A0A0K8NYG8_PISS1|nr:hypothetical protein ISF6_0520 [Piscinibacter sakaiensis]